MQDIQDDLRPLLRRGLMLLVVGFGGFLALAAWAPVDQALPGVGSLAAASQRKAVQPALGGTVRALHVAEGNAVRAGQLLVELDSSAAQAEQAAARRQALLLAASRERLSALLQGQGALVFSAELKRDAAALPEGAGLLDTQAALFRSLAQGRRDGAAQLAARRAQLAREAEGQQAGLTEQRAQRDLVQQQTAQLEDLARQGYYPRLKLADAQRQLHAAQQEEARGKAELARLQEAAREADAAQSLRGVELQRDWQAELLEAERQGAQLAARLATLAQQIAQSRLLAPVDGTVVGLAVHTVGGVVQGGQTLMELVPRDDELVVDSRFPLVAGEKLHAGQPADLVFTSLDRTHTPTLRGRVLTVSADRLEDNRSGAGYLRVRVALAEGERARLRGVELRAGLPVEVMVSLGERSLLGWWLKPLADRLGRAFSE
jgi:membrane fusion protein, protease secretion system